MSTLRVEIVSAEHEIYSGEANWVIAPAVMGEVGIYPRHTPLITHLKPGEVRVSAVEEGEELLFFVSGGMLEVQPHQVTVLSDTAMRGADLDEGEGRGSQETGRTGAVRPQSRFRRGSGLGGAGRGGGTAANDPETAQDRSRLIPGGVKCPRYCKSRYLMGTEAVILAGGIGKRLAQATPKPLLDLCGKPLLGHVMETAAAVADKVHVVHGPPLGEPLAELEKVSKVPFTSHLQPEPRGTADALGCALPSIEDAATVVVLCADAPLLQPDTLMRLLSARSEAGLALLTMRQSGNQLGGLCAMNMAKSSLSGNTPMPRKKSVASTNATPV